MKSNTIVLLVIVLVVVNIMAIQAWPFGFRSGIQGFKNMRVGKQGFQNMTPPAMPVLTQPPGAPGATRVPTPLASSLKVPSMSTTTASTPMPPPTPMPTTMPSMPPTTMPSQTSTPVATPTIPMLPIATPNMPAPVVGQPRMDASGNIIQGFRNVSEMQGAEFKKKEGFTNRFLDNAGGARDLYQPMGAFDGVSLPTGRQTLPNEPLLGAEFTPGDDSLFIFKNNQCKPECCGASFSCSGGCVCTTPQQRDYINGRGGNRTAPADD
jgi:hypothetical protein